MRQGQLQNSIYRAFDETENLLGKLRQDPQQLASPTSPASAPATSSLTSANGGTKKPKDDKVVIEELEVANCHLRRMVDSLFVELDHCQRENLELKERMKELEDKMRLANMTQGHGPLVPVPSPPRREPEPDLTPLAPLEMPTFNFQH